LTSLSIQNVPTAFVVVAVFRLISRVRVGAFRPAAVAIVDVDADRHGGVVVQRTVQALGIEPASREVHLLQQHRADLAGGQCMDAGQGHDHAKCRILQCGASYGLHLVRSEGCWDSDRQLAALDASHRAGKDQPFGLEGAEQRPQGTGVIGTMGPIGQPAGDVGPCDLPQGCVLSGVLGQERQDAPQVRDDRCAGTGPAARGAVSQDGDPSVQLGTDVWGEEGQVFLAPGVECVGPVVEEDVEFLEHLQDVVGRHCGVGELGDGRGPNSLRWSVNRTENAYAASH
jgi:hypothetical protein